MAAVAAQLSLPFTPYAGVSPVAYSAPFPYAAAPAMTYAGAPFAYPGVAVAYTAPGPITYQTGAKVVAKYEPVEQHGYSIVY